MNCVTTVRKFQNCALSRNLLRRLFRCLELFTYDMWATLQCRVKHISLTTLCAGLIPAMLPAARTTLRNSRQRKGQTIHSTEK